MAKSSKPINKKVLGVAGVALAGLAATAAGAYLFAGKEGAKNRRKVTAWSEKAKKEIVDEVKKLEKVSKQTYESAIDQISDRYKQLKHVKPGDLQAFISDAKGHWNNISKEIGAVSNIAKRVTKKAAKKVSKVVTGTTKKPVAKKKSPAKKKAKKK
jgi:hypothetical protein